MEMTNIEKDLRNFFKELDDGREPGQVAVDLCAWMLENDPRNWDRGCREGGLWRDLLGSLHTRFYAEEPEE